MQSSRSKKLLDKVYDYLDTIDVTKLSMKELQDFLEVVQKGQFLESLGKVPPYPFGGFGLSNAPFPRNAGNGKSGDCDEECKTITEK